MVNSPDSEGHTFIARSVKLVALPSAINANNYILPKLKRWRAKRSTSNTEKYHLKRNPFLGEKPELNQKDIQAYCKDSRYLCVKPSDEYPLRSGLTAT